MMCDSIRKTGFAIATEICCINIRILSVFVGIALGSSGESLGTRLPIAHHYQASAYGQILGDGLVNDWLLSVVFV